MRAQFPSKLRLQLSEAPIECRRGCIRVEKASPDGSLLQRKFFLTISCADSKSTAKFSHYLSPYRIKSD